MLLTAPWLLPGGDQNFALHSAAAGAAAATAVDEADGKKRKRKRGDKEKKVRDPLLPKRPPSAYLLYQNEVRKHMQEKFKELPYKEVLGEISKAWNAMTPEDKQMYQEATKVAKATYDDAKAEYDKAHGIEVVSRVYLTPRAWVPCVQRICADYILSLRSRESPSPRPLLSLLPPHPRARLRNRTRRRRTGRRRRRRRRWWSPNPSPSPRSSRRTAAAPTIPRRATRRMRCPSRRRRSNIRRRRSRRRRARTRRARRKESPVP
ncbi:hypothetical protein EXIGLDRAFT_622021 [Exidia glandulosa HHB12029]|uniref:HMG box domain-containing protein n=1 Tax=Exidia glandulosa HHB12029 TaxID=1314781 RepID=A0A165EAE0_EXIGL|nr:hypothetical protein EXIGLDRAFT_622021 [Exidia glandulosa HHB12029]